MKQVLLSLFFIVCFKIHAQKSYDITINFTGMEADKGNLYVALYDKKEAFLKEEYKGQIVSVINKRATVVFTEVPKGEYAVSAFHDENDNKKMDTNFLGIPKEPIGISNDGKSFIGVPKFKKAKFFVNKNVFLKITLR